MLLAFGCGGRAPRRHDARHSLLLLEPRARVWRAGHRALPPRLPRRPHAEPVCAMQRLRALRPDAHSRRRARIRPSRDRSLRPRLAGTRWPGAAYGAGRREGPVVHALSPRPRTPRAHPVSPRRDDQARGPGARARGSFPRRRAGPGRCAVLGQPRPRWRDHLRRGLSGPPDLVAAAFHWLEYLGLLGGIGSLVVRRLGRMRPRIGWAEPPMHVAFGAALAGGLGLLIAEPAWPVAARVLAEGLALFLCVRGLRWVAVPAVFAAAVLPPAGHAAGVIPAAGAEFADALHVLSAGMWAGGILALASLQPPGGWRGEEGRAPLDRFARIAPIAFGVTALTGVLRATEQLTGLSDLWSTAYGLVLVFKAAGVLVMLALSALAWGRGLPVARPEAGVAVVVVGATAFLAAFPLPA